MVQVDTEEHSWTWFSLLRCCFLVSWFFFLLLWLKCSGKGNLRERGIVLVHSSRWQGRQATVAGAGDGWWRCIHSQEHSAGKDYRLEPAVLSPSQIIQNSLLRSSATHSGQVFPLQCNQGNPLQACPQPKPIWKFPVESLLPGVSKLSWVDNEHWPMRFVLLFLLLIFFKKNFLGLIFKFVCMYVCLCVCTYECSAHRLQKREIVLLELELWVLGTEFWSWARAMSS